jgi:transcriptional regulator with XRE-family HTH domain
MENEPKIFTAWLRKVIKDDKQITAKELAKRIGCDPTTISSYIRNRTKPNFETRAQILDATDTPMRKC